MIGELTPEAIEASDLTSDPYPELPVIEAGDLRDGDELMMLGEGWAMVYEHHKIERNLP